MVTLDGGEETTNDWKVTNTYNLNIMIPIIWLELYMMIPVSRYSNFNLVFYP